MDARPAGDDEIDLREVFDLLKSGRWLILSCICGALFLGALYVVFARPVYQVDGLVQVEQTTGPSGGMSQALGSLAGMLGGGTLVTDAEIQIIQSRRVLNPAIDQLNLLIDARPNYFPFIGYTLARRNSAVPGAEGQAPSVAGAWPLLGRWAWGGESIAVAEFETAPADYDSAFVLEATPEGYALFSPDGGKVLDGAVGHPASGRTRNGPVHILVRRLVARTGETFKVTRYARQTMLKILSDRITVAEQGKQSGVVRISVQGHDRAAALALVNAIENAYIQQDVEKNSEQATQSLEYLEKQLPDLRIKMNAAQDKLAAYQKQHGAADVASETKLLLNQAVALDTARSQLVQQRDQALQRFTAQHPVVVGLDRQIATVESNQAALKAQIAKLPDTQQEVLDLMRNLDVSTQLYTTMLDAIQQFQVTKAGTIGNVRIVDYGMLPLKPVAPKKALTLVLALLLGGFVGVAWVFLRRVLLAGVDDPVELEQSTGLDVLASIPLSKKQARLDKRAKYDPKTPRLLAIGEPEDPVIEALRSLRTALMLGGEQPRNNILMFTGPVPEIGKSFTSANYAAVLAQSGARVALLDLDFRLGHLADSFRGDNDLGLSAVLRGEASLDAVQQSTRIDGLALYARGRRPKHPAELLMSDRFTATIRALSTAYDHVVIDAPPVLAVTDALIIGAQAGATLVVLESARHPQRDIDETIKRLANARIHMAGLIMNRVGAKAGSYGYGNYGYSYYNYQYGQKQD